MDVNQGYSILKVIMLENGRGFALGEHPTAPSPYVTWACYDDRQGVRQYEWGHYGNDRAAAEQDLSRRVREYRRIYRVDVDHTEAPGLYKYYSTQRPVDIGTFPKPSHNEPDEIVNFDQRGPVEGGAFLAWGYLTYTRPLTRQEAADYELRPSRGNPDLKRQMEEQTQIVGQWEEARHIPDSSRLTWFYPDFGCYVLKEFVTPERLAAMAEKIDGKAPEKKTAPIADQMKAAAERAQREAKPPAPDKAAPDREGR